MFRVHHDQKYDWVRIEGYPPNNVFLERINSRQCLHTLLQHTIFIVWCQYP